MKNVYETPVAEVVNFTALERIATLEVRLDFNDDNFSAGIGSRNDF